MCGAAVLIIISLPITDRVDILIKNHNEDHRQNSPPVPLTSGYYSVFVFSDNGTDDYYHQV